MGIIGKALCIWDYVCTYEGTHIIGTFINMEEKNYYDENDHHHQSVSLRERTRTQKCTSSKSTAIQVDVSKVEEPLLSCKW